MSSRTLLAGALLAVCLGASGCTGRQVMSLKERAPQAAATGPAPSMEPWKGPAVSASSTYPKDINSARPEPPADFVSQKNPLTATPANLSKGKELYTGNCAPCHGNTGAGDGAAAAALNPKPADFKTPIHEKLPDGYWFWRISKGGAVPPFVSSGSAMPPWEGALNPEQRWLVILYEHTFSEHK